MASTSGTTPDDPADIDKPEEDPAPDAVGTEDPIVESIEETGEPSPGNFA